VKILEFEEKVCYALENIYGVGTFESGPYAPHVMKEIISYRGGAEENLALTGYGGLSDVGIFCPRRAR